MRHLTRGFAAVAIVLLLSLDRYSYGQVGGEGQAAVAATHWWQAAAAGLLLFLIGAAAWFTLRGRLGGAVAVLRTELVLFLMLNLLFLWRDGEGRLVCGFEHDRTGQWIVLGGLAARVVLLWSYKKQRGTIHPA